MKEYVHRERLSDREKKSREREKIKFEEMTYSRF